MRLRLPGGRQEAHACAIKKRSWKQTSRVFTIGGLKHSTEQALVPTISS